MSGGKGNPEKYREGGPDISEVRETLVAGGVQSQSASFDRTVLSEKAAEASGAAHIEEGTRFLRVGELGRGGMGRVDLYYDRVLARTVARKSVLPEGLHAQFLLSEAQIGAQLEHPSIVPVYDVGFDAHGRPEYTMRVVRGRTLREVLEDARAGHAAMSLVQLLGVIRSICLAVDYSHSRGVVHRDLKPDNVILGEFGEVYVLDWGVAHLMASSDIKRSADTPPGLAVAGSPGYMAPEQAMGENIDARTDVFAIGVMLYEILSGARPFEDRDIPSVLRRISSPLETPPSKRGSKRDVPAAFDDLVVACLSRSPDLRPQSARLIADEIDAFLDGERARLERLRDADVHAREGHDALESFQDLEGEAMRMRTAAEALLADLRSWEPAERKQSAWDMSQRAQQMAGEAARALARAEAAFTRSLGRAPHHGEARRGLAELYFNQFEAAEKAADKNRMAQYLDLARAYDDGPLSLELADRGVVTVAAASAGLRLTLSRYEPTGLTLVPRLVQELRVREPVLVDSGSYVVLGASLGVEIRYPLMVRRAEEHSVTLDSASCARLPSGMIIIPGGLFLGLAPQAKTMSQLFLGDFAIARFPVTLAEYVLFLDSIANPEERRRRTPGYGEEGPVVEKTAGVWRITPRCVEGEARQRVPPERELELPVHEISWYDARAYTEWRARKDGRPYRLPTDLEWEKALRGADGRAFPMGDDLDPCFAKRRESRPEPVQLEPVGAFPLDESPYGIRDLAGSVGDWTSTFVDGGDPPPEGAEGTAATDERQAYWRGGTWSSTAAIPAMRYSQMLRHRVGWVGFRLAMSLDSPGGSSLQVTPMKKA